MARAKMRVLHYVADVFSRLVSSYLVREEALVDWEDGEMAK